MKTQRILNVGGSFTVRQVSSFTSMDSIASLHTNNNIFLLAVDQSETKIQISGAIHLVNLRTPLKVYLIPLFMIILVPLDKVLNL